VGYPLVKTALSYVIRFDTILACGGRTDRNAMKCCAPAVKTQSNEKNDEHKKSKKLTGQARENSPLDNGCYDRNLKR